MPDDWEIQELTEPTTPEFIQKEGHAIKSPDWTIYHRHKTWNSFLLQKANNQRIVKECKELLEKLKE
jgi:hypothetical protein